MSEIYCDVCKDQDFFCPRCKTKAIHLDITKSDEIPEPSISKVTSEHSDVKTGEQGKSYRIYDLHNFLCKSCHIMFGLYDLGEPTRTIT